MRQNLLLVFTTLPFHLTFAVGSHAADDRVEEKCAPEGFVRHNMGTSVFKNYYGTIGHTDRWTEADGAEYVNSQVNRLPTARSPTVRKM